MKTIVAALGLAAAAALTVTPIAIDGVTGVYKYQFDNGFADGTPYKSENVLEIVKVSRRQAYVRAYLQFFNGHSCDISGVAQLEKGALVYRPHENEGQGKCEFTLERKGDEIVFGDKNFACKYMYCGARGSFNGESFPLSSRRPIRYMPRLLASSQYATAMSEQGLAAPPPKVVLKVEPMRAQGRDARYPRLNLFSSGAIRAKVNAKMAQLEGQEREDWNDCASRLSATDSKAFRVDMRVSYLTARYLNVTLAANHECAGAVGNTSVNATTIDLATGEYVDWDIVFKPSFLHGARGAEDEGQLAALYRARLASQRDDCRKGLVPPLHFVFWLDARKGLMVEPEGRESKGCDRVLALSPQEIAPYVQDARLLADLMATVRT